MIALRPRDQHVWDPRPLPHETEAETKTNYCKTETETETKKWSRDHAGLVTLTSLFSTVPPQLSLSEDSSLIYVVSLSGWKAKEGWHKSDAESLQEIFEFLWK